MEFEKNAPTTAEDVALADAPRVTLQPVHSELSPETTSPFETRQAETVFPFEAESSGTTAGDSALTTDATHHKVALILTVLVVAVFVASMVAFLLTR